VVRLALTDPDSNEIVPLSGPRFGGDFMLTSQADNAPATCPAPGFPPNYLGSLNPWTGHITRVAVSGPVFEPQGMVFVSPGWAVTPG
jgi:hypothetical protein